ncbi:HTH Tnp Tc3 2 domain containing protein, partial [Asbolus verrucosus]
MFEVGLRQLEVAERFRISQSVVMRLWTRYRGTGSVCRRRGQGRGRCTTVGDDRFLTLNARRNPNIAATSLLRELRNASEARPSVRTVRNRLHGVGLRSQRPLQRVPLT